MTKSKYQTIRYLKLREDLPHQNGLKINLHKSPIILTNERKTKLNPWPGLAGIEKIEVRIPWQILNEKVILLVNIESRERK